VRPAGSPRDFAFRHAVVRRAIYEQAPPGWQLAAHGRVAAALAARGAPAGVRAEHVEVVARPGDAVAAAVLEQAGDDALTRDPVTAARWYEAALRLGGEDRPSLLFRLARSQAGGGHLDAARDTLLVALGDLDPQDVATSVALSHVCASIEQLLGHTTAAYDRLLAALARVPASEVALRVALEVELAVNAKYRVGAEDLMGLTAGALESARALGDRPLLVSAASVHAVNCFHSGRYEEALSLRAEAEATAAESSDLELAARMDALYHAALAATVTDDFPAGAALAQRGVRIGRATGQDQLLVPLLIFRVMALHQWGRITEGLAVSEEAEDSARLGGTAHMLHWALWMRATMAEAAGDLETATRVGEESVRVAEGLDPGTVVTLGRANLAAIRLSAGDPERCRREMLDAAGEEFEVGEASWGCHLMNTLVRALVELGEFDEAERWAGLAEERAAALGGPPVPAGRAACARAEVLLVRGEAERAAELAEAAARDAAELQARVNVWQANLVAARAQAAAGRRERAVALLRGVVQETGAQGAGLYRVQAERELRRLGERVGRGGRRARAGAEGIQALSGREREVAGRVAEGLTNKQIAGALYLSEKTVEAHLSRIYGKLGVRSRVDLARLVAQAGAGD
jgi:DNA-binding CsgD family transcriptional regulator